MAKFTTEVRTICEWNSGLTESEGYGSIGDVIEKSRAKIFNFEFPMYDESYRSVLETKILRHYYTREIGFETVGLWKLKLETKLNEVMPYFNQMYNSTLLEFNPFYDVDITTDSNRGIKHDENSSTSSTHEDSTKSNSSGEHQVERSGNVSGESKTVDKYSDTPQGALTGLEEDQYLTEARITSDSDSRDTNSSESGSQSGSQTSSMNASDSGSGTRAFTNTDEYLEHVRGKRGGESYSKLLKEYRQTFLNIDMMVIDSLEELFMQVW